MATKQAAAEGQTLRNQSTVAAQLRRVKAAARKLRAKQLLSHEDRQALIHMPMPHVRYIEAKTWAGTMTHREHIPTEGHKSFNPTPEDEQIIALHFEGATTVGAMGEW